jgi:hypothetical protein
MRAPAIGGSAFAFAAFQAYWIADETAPASSYDPPVVARLATGGLIFLANQEAVSHSGRPSLADLHLLSPEVSTREQQHEKRLQS